MQPKNISGSMVTTEFTLSIGEDYFVSSHQKGVVRLTLTEGQPGL